MPREQFISFLELKRLSDRTIQEYLRYYDLFWGDEKFNQVHVDHFIKDMNNPVCRAFIKNYRSYLIRTNPDNQAARNVEVERVTGFGKKPLPKYVSKAQVDKIENSADTERTKLMIRTSFDGGLRRQGLLELKPSSYKWDEWEEGRPLAILVKEKQRKERIIFIPNALAKRTRDYIHKNKIKWDSSLWVIKKTTWAKLLNRAAIKGIGTRLNPHALRHSFAAHLINNGIKIEELKELMGHDDISTTIIYAHLDKKKIQDKYEKIMN